MGGFEGGAELFEALGFGARGDGVDVGNSALDLVEDSDGVGLAKDGGVADEELDGAGVGGDVAGAAAQAAADAEGDPGRFGDADGGAARCREFAAGVALPGDETAEDDLDLL